MELHDNTFIKTEGLLWEGVLKSVAKSPNKLQPIFEAVTNSLESLILLKRTNPQSIGEITIEIHYNKTLFSDTDDKVDFDKIIVKDNGVGFDDENFDRVFRYKDIRKGFNNRGSGRLQFLHYFDKTQVVSIFQNGSEFLQREFTLSKSKRFVVDNNATIYYIGMKPSDVAKLETLVTFSIPLDDKDKSYYEEINIHELKEIIINRYMMVLCSQRNSLPEIKIYKYYNSELQDSATITIEDIPELDKQETFGIYYSKMSKDLKRIERNYSRSENFTVSAYKIGNDKLKHNSIKVTSKNEVIDNIKIKLENLKNDDFIDNKRYLFFISSPYIDELDGDVRGDDIVFLTKTDFKKSAKEYGYIDDKILLDDIEEQVNDRISVMYDEIKKKAQDKVEEIKKLTEMFLLNEETVKELRISINDSNDKILEKIYAADSKIVANQDAEIKNIIDTLDSLNPADKEEYQENFEKLISELVYNIPLQDRTTLSRYVARRKLILDLYYKILNKKLNIQNDGSRNNDEALLHNLIFRQKSNNPSDSDLWIINEDFIYFKGCSEQRLCDVKMGKLSLFKKEFEAKEEEYLKSLGENRLEERPDILLFPEEGKCIIIELKNPNRNIGLHLNEITHYASLIRNFTVDEFQIDTFYGYLIGEGINHQDVRTYDGDFKPSYQFDYMFRPAKTIPGEYGRKDGSLYTEILSYTTLHKRASKRNEIFIKKIGLQSTSDYVY
ncbi:MAG: ATP-binding protein [Firmicutes bacterium]|nr:ATP-binding protein [Bacillota bacterium]